MTKIKLAAFRNHFASGLLVLGPLYLSVLFIGYLIRLTDRLVVNPLFEVLPFQMDAQFKVFFTKIAIGAIVILIVSVVGLVAEKFLIRKVISSGEAVIKNIPFFSNIYSSIKEIAQAFFGEKQGQFGRVVYVEYPRREAWAVAFVTNESPWEVHEKVGKDLITIFVPKPPNPATGFFISVPKSQVIDSDMTVEEGIRMVLSFGAVAPPPRNNKDQG